MDRKNVLFIMLGMIILVIFISGCIKLIEEKLTEPTSVLKESVVSKVNQKIITGLMDQLKSVVNNYEASYKKEQEVHSWADHSGAIDYIATSNISIKVSKGQVVEYTVKHIREGRPVKKEDYYKYYDKSQDRLCKEEIVSKSGCNPVPLDPPKLGGTLTGCRLSLHPDGKGKCICDGELKPIEDYLGFACSEEKNTENMEIRYGHAIYYPETKKGFCYYEAKDKVTGELWAFECDQEDIELKPLVTNNLEPLSNVKCYRYGHNSCTCTFTPVKTLVCSKDKPSNFDADVKQEIIDYLKDVTISSISEEDNEYGHCYVFFYNQLEHIFCFNEEGLITFAQWGSNIRKARSASVNINRIENI